MRTWSSLHPGAVGGICSVSLIPSVLLSPRAAYLWVDFIAWHVLTAIVILLMCRLHGFGSALAPGKPLAAGSALLWASVFSLVALAAVLARLLTLLWLGVGWAGSLSGAVVPATPFRTIEIVVPGILCATSVVGAAFSFLPRFNGPRPRLPSLMKCIGLTLSAVLLWAVAFTCFLGTMSLRHLTELGALDRLWSVAVTAPVLVALTDLKTGCRGLQPTDTCGST